jgi:uncharacterized protein (TIRG00374 family)
MGLFDSLTPGKAAPFRWSKALLRLAVSLAVFAAVFWFADLDWATMMVGIERVGPGHWALAVAAFLFLHAIGALKWCLFLRIAGAHITVADALRFYAAGLFSNLCLPSLVGGDAVRAGLAMTRARSKAAVLMGGAVDRVSDLVALGLLVGVGCVMAPDALERMETAEQPIDPLVIVGVFFALLLLGAVSVLVFFRVRPPSTWPEKLRAKGESLLRAIKAVKGAPRRALVGLALCFGMQASFVAINAYLGGVMDVGLDYALWYLLWPLAKIAAMMPFSLGGMGVREAALAILVAPFGEGVKNMAVAQSLVWQTVLIAGGIVSGTLWLVSGRLGKRGGANGDGDAGGGREDRAVA